MVTVVFIIFIDVTNIVIVTIIITFTVTILIAITVAICLVRGLDKAVSFLAMICSYLLTRTRCLEGQVCYACPLLFA